MAKDNEQYSREQGLAREYERKLAARENVVQSKVRALVGNDNMLRRSLLAVFDNAFNKAFAAGKYEKPSEFFLGEMSWIFGPVVYERFRDAFLDAVDRVLEYPSSTGYFRRGFRSTDYRSYANRIGYILNDFRMLAVVDADICDILTGDLPEDARCYLQTRKVRESGFASELLAYELDRDNPRLESIVTDIVNGEGGFSVVSRSLIRGIVLSHNERMHQLLCRLLLAARLQEGLRQAICENADWGTRAAFRAILTTIAEHDLIRYSSVKRAVGTWLGILSEECRELDRVSGKSVELMVGCLSDPAFREACLTSEDAMKIHVALWSYGIDSVQQAVQVLDRLCRDGTHHQLLTAGYFVCNLDDPLLMNAAARVVLRTHRERTDLLAVYLPCLLPYHRNSVRHLLNKEETPWIWRYFPSREEAREVCDWLVAVHGSMKKRELVFEPCIFPWHKAVLKRSDLVEKAMLLALFLEDQERIDALCAKIGDCDSYYRENYFRIMTMGQLTPAVRAAVIRGLADKNSDTRWAAYKRCCELELAPEECLQIEDMLRLRYEDLRRNVIELLLKQPEKQLEGIMARLLRDPKPEKRTAALDMLTRLNKQEDKAELVRRCLPLVREIPKLTTQEQILLDALAPAQPGATEEPLFTEADRYVPVVELDDYGKSCIRAFMGYFPHTRLEEQILAGQRVVHDDRECPTQPEPTAGARDRLRDLSDYIVAHEKEHFEGGIGVGTYAPISVREEHFFARDPKTQEVTAPRMDLWEHWMRDRQVTVAELLAMLVLASAQELRHPYLKRCGKYMADLFGSGFECQVRYRYLGHMRRILMSLLNQILSRGERLQLAAALGIWIHRCLPDEMLIGDSGMEVTAQQPRANHFMVHYGNPQLRIEAEMREQMVGNPAGHFIAHPQLAWFVCSLKPLHDGSRRHIIPIWVSLFERTFDSTRDYMRIRYGKTVTDRQTLVLNQLYLGVDRWLYQYTVPDVTTYLYARHDGLISDRTLYYHLMQPWSLKKALELVTSVCVMRPTEGNLVSSRCFAGYRGNVLRRRYEDFIGKDKELSRDQLGLIELCRTVADKLVGIVVGAELLRGDSPAEYSQYVTGIQSLSGAETFVGILSALGKDALDRSVYYWGSSDSKRGNLSHLLARCAPAGTDSAETLGKLLKGTDISEKRLIEAALYSPEWIDIIRQYLNLPGFKSACYYFMAHMNERFDEQKKAIIARFSPLSEDELNAGAFDVQWFHTAFAQLGEKKFELIYEAAKYISDGNKHTRARKYADAALGRLDVEETQAAIREKRNKDLLMAYAIIPLKGEEDLVRRYLYLQQFLKESRQFGSQRSASEKKAVETALRNLATNAGFSDTMRLTLRMETKLVEDSRELFSEKQVGEWVFRLVVDDQGASEVQCFKDGKQLKSIPAKVKKEEYVVRLLDMKKLLTDQYRRTRRMFEQAMEDGTSFSLDELRQLAQNQVVVPIVSKLVFKSGAHLGLFHGGKLTALDGQALTEKADAPLTVAHPLHLYQSGQWIDFQKYIFDEKIIQPFKQVFRELYVKTREELGCLRSARYAGNQIQPRKAAACLKERRWVADVEAGLQKVYYQENIVATIFALADWFSPADIEAPTLEYVAFFHRKTGQPLKIDDIPDVIFSEVMRDVDMAVSVAHAGGVDPETSHSTVEMRAAILGFTLPLLRLDNVQISGSHAVIEGKLARYSVHLGSGIVHQLGGTMLNVLPVHSQHRGRLFLPFIDDDPKTAEIISKVILFSEDSKLKDPSILSQISLV